MATEDITVPAAKVTTTRSINWGGVVKGAVIVTAVVVACVVGASVVSGIAGWAMANPTIGPALGTVYSYAHAGLLTMGNWLAAGAAHIMNFISPLAPATGHAAAAATASSSHTLSFATKEAIGKAASWIGLGGAAAVAVPPALHALNTTPMTQVDTHTVYTQSAAINSGLITPTTTMAHTAEMTTHAAHHAAEHSSKEEAGIGGWAHKFADKAGFTSHADAVRTTQAERTPIPQRDASFASQLDADSANLQHALDR